MYLDNDILEFSRVGTPLGGRNSRLRLILLRLILSDAPLTGLKEYSGLLFFCDRVSLDSYKIDASGRLLVGTIGSLVQQAAVSQLWHLG